MFLSPQLLLRLSEGSGNFHLDYQPKDVARVQYHALNRTLEVIPLMNGEVKITVNDLCLWTNSPAVATIQVFFFFLILTTRIY